MKKALFLIGLLLSASMAQGAPRSMAQKQAAARRALNHQRSSRHLAPSLKPLTVIKSMEQLDIIGTEDDGFVVVAADDLLPAVLGVSSSPYSKGCNPNFEWWLTATEAAARQLVRSQAPMLVTKPDTTRYPEEVPTMVATKWYQAEPYNNMCPAFNDSVNCLTGCVATAMAQVLNYHRMPVHGQGERTIYYPYNRPSGQAVTATFEQDYYDWSHMLNDYSTVDYTQEEADAVALLMRDCGVAADMQYGGPDEGSGAYTQNAAEGLRDFFGFPDAQCLTRDSHSEAEWMNIIYRELSKNGPICYGGSSFMSGGHAFVLDGYDAEGRVSINWGWAGEDDGYFFINQLTPSGYNFNMGQDMIIGISSQNHALLRSEVLTLTEAGKLAETLEQADTLNDGSRIGSLVVKGPLNKHDLTYLRHLAGRDADGAPTQGRLSTLDLTGASLEDDLLPDSIFKGCSRLRRVRLPESLTAIGREAFMDCSSLSELRVASKKVPELLGASVFEGMPLGTTKLYVYSGLKTKYVQAAQWSDFGEKNIYQIGTSVKVRNAIRFYGEENPEFYYNVTGDAIKGQPVLTCEATQWSPAGRYPIHVSAGTVENPDAVNFIDGYIIVRKVDGVEAKVADVVREEGEPNPDFELRYTGLLSHDSVPTWLSEPVITTEANEESPAGEYVIEVTGGEAESYAVTFLPGKLTVKPKPVVDGIAAIGSTAAPATVYNLQGQRVNASRKGLFIRNGKKVVK